jgi:hypothetical protein
MNLFCPFILGNPYAIAYAGSLIVAFQVLVRWFPALGQLIKELSELIV